MLEIVETPILTRREREKIQLRQAILDATQAIAAKEGWQAVTTRKVAEKIEYSLPTLYEYFENKEKIYIANALTNYSVKQVRCTKKN